ncbi:MAG: endolytic transglycosylase MltG [Campylobacterota bacterium]|nr:endolytic transglycosylase MltG [Campylobacterota bacterium]
MNNIKLTIIKWIFNILLIIILSFIFYLNKPINTPKVIYIPNGSINKIISHLGNEKYDVCKLDSLFLRLIGSPQHGWIDISVSRSTKADFLYKLINAKAALQNITLIPGETTHIFLNQLANNLQLDRDKLQKEYDLQSPIKEGAFVPNTYKLPIGITEKELIKILLNHSKSKMQEISNKFFGNYNEKRWYEYIAIASVIQKESANNKEMPIVSSVIYNRIKKGMKLQMDGTLNYGKYSHLRVTPKRIREDMSLYNTYKYKGIPKYPVCNVSFEAIRAAVFPAKTNYLYFMKSKNGTHDFTRNYSTHLHNIRRATK